MSDLDFSAVEMFVEEKNIWKIPYFSTLAIRLLRTNVGEQYTVSISLFFFSIQLTLLYNFYTEICLGIHKMYFRLGFGWQGTKIEEE
tara:strand:- start:1529 stop:1789 length:261 start_codon:yes stop_codon:yes gene_type:complete